MMMDRSITSRGSLSFLSFLYCDDGYDGGGGGAFVPFVKQTHSLIPLPLFSLLNMVVWWN
jgi:hypothetical protein